MKASILGLVVSTAAFGASTVYFWQQFSEARAQADEVAAANRRLNERVAELEKARDELMARRIGAQPGGNPFVAGVIDQHHPTAANVAASSSTDQAGGKDGAEAKDAQRFGVFQRPQMPPSMVKTIRNQLRAQNEKNYFDLKDRLGLSQEDASRLLDLITDQQAASFTRPRNPNDPNAADPSRSDWQRIEGQISDLLGPAKAAEYANYQKEMPARMEVAMLAQQFESSDAPLSDQQRKRLIAVLSEERETVPMPSFSNGASHEQYAKDYAAWQSDYEQRVSERARSILSANQLGVYDEYQQFQKEIRAQMAAQGRVMPGPGGVATMVGPNMRMRVGPPPPPRDRPN